MSCNGCRVLRKGCSESCILRPCLEWIENPEAQGHATVFVAKFFGRACLMSFLSSVPDSQRPDMFRSLLFEACGRTINPVTGAVGLLWSKNWHMCQTAVETVFRGGVLQPMSQIYEQVEELRGDNTCSQFQPLINGTTGSKKQKKIVADGEAMVIYRPGTPSTMNSDESVMTTSCCFEGDSCDQRHRGKLLNLFV